MAIVGLTVVGLGVAGAEPRGTCDELIARLGSHITAATCVESPDLTTNNPSTTPADNSLAGLPAFAFTPQTDRAVIAPDAAHRTPITHTVPGVQLEARIADDPAGEARLLVRLPDAWNGRLVVAGASGTRSEFNGDFAWSDFVVQKGYAYVSQNKGIFNLRLSTASDPLACRLNPSSQVFVHFYDNDPGTPFTRWRDFMLEAARLGSDAMKAHYGDKPRYTYAVGTSNGGYQVRRAIEAAPDLFDGGVDWEGTFVDPVAPNLLTDLPPAVLNFPDYVASGFDPNSTAAKNIRATGYPPDLVANGQSLWARYSAQFWEVTLCQWQKRLDPTYDTYGSGTGAYNYLARLSASEVGQNVAAFATTGQIKRPLVTVAGTMDALLPIDRQARAYARSVARALSERTGDRGDDDAAPAYRLYEVQNGNHIETFAQSFPQLELIEPHAQRAFELLVDSVEKHTPLPPDQCIPRGGALASSPSQPGHCAALLKP
jgi:3HB-oligomer hydrolase (3HBOH)